MKRGIFINLVALITLLLVALSPILVGVSMGWLGEVYGCNMSGAGDFGPDPCTTIVALLVTAGWMAIGILPIGVGLLLLYVLGVTIFYFSSLVRGRRAGRGASPFASGMMVSTLGAALVVAALVGIVAGVIWLGNYRSAAVSACKGLPVPTPLAGVRNGPLALSVNLQDATPEELTSLLVVSPDGQNLAQKDNLRSANDLAWSPDAQQLAFTGRAWDSGQYGLYLMDRQGQVSAPLFADERLQISDPDWTPSGSLVFARWTPLANGGYDSEIFQSQPDGSDVLRLTTSPQSDEQPRVSPDGRWIAFVSQQDGGQDIYRMDVDGSNVAPLTSGADQATNPAWSPDGQWIVFATNRDSPSGKNNYNLYIMAPDGTNQCRLTQGEDSELNPVWSPDGMWIAYTSLLERKVYLVRPDGTQVTALPLPVAVDDINGLDWAAESKP